MGCQDFLSGRSAHAQLWREKEKGLFRKTWFSKVRERDTVGSQAV